MNFFNQQTPQAIKLRVVDANIQPLTARFKSRKSRGITDHRLALEDMIGFRSGINEPPWAPCRLGLLMIVPHAGCKIPCSATEPRFTQEITVK